MDKYEQSYDPPRTFPQEVLLGAEATLAKMLHELLVTRIFNPVPLGEILQSRAFTATGQVNPWLAKSKNTKALGITAEPGGGFEFAVEEKELMPGTQWSLLDALEAQKWAYVWATYTTDEDAELWVAFFRKEIRLRPNQVELVRVMYEAASWRLALAMRTGQTFSEASAELRQDSVWRRDFMETFKPPDRQARGTREARVVQLHGGAVVKALPGALPLLVSICRTSTASAIPVGADPPCRDWWSHVARAAKEEKAAKAARATRAEKERPKLCGKQTQSLRPSSIGRPLG